jgi:hypothetical protein
VSQAEKNLSLAVQRLNTLRKQNASSQQIRTAECDWFGAEETLALAKAAQDGYLESVYQSCLPAEIQIFKIGNWSFIAWPGEQFVEYSLAVKQKDRNAFVISLANGELQGYIVTQEAEKEAGYEASNALFEYKSGDILVEQTLDMLKTLNQRM